MTIDTGWTAWLDGEQTWPMAVAWWPNVHRLLDRWSEEDVNQMLGFRAFLAAVGKPAAAIR